MASEDDDSPKLARQGLRRTLNSFYECVSVGLYNKVASCGYVRSQVWDCLSKSFFGCDVAGLTRAITESSPVTIPQGPMMAWRSRYARAWVDLGDPENKRGRSDESYRRLFLDTQSQFNLARYIISHATEPQSPDIDLVGPVVCDCFNVGLVVLEVGSLRKPPTKVFSPSKEKTASAEWAKATRMYVHMLKDGSYWDHLIEDNGGTFCVPKHVIHKLTEEDLFEGTNEASSPESFRMNAGSVYQVRVYDASLRKNMKVGDMIPPQHPNRVHYLEVDCTNVKNNWVFTLWRPQMSRPGVQLAVKSVWIFARLGDEARCISVWKRDITGPRFLMDKRETAIYTVEADSHEEAAACVRAEFMIQVKASN